MSKNQKTKVDPRVQRTQLQQRRAMIENELFRTMLRMLKAMDAYEQFMALSAAQRTFFKKVQFRSVMIKPETGHRISEAVTDAVKKDLAAYLHSQKVTLSGSAEQFTLYDVATVGNSLWQMARFEKDARWQAVYARLGPLMPYFEGTDRESLVNIILRFLQELARKFSHIDKYFLWFTWHYRYIDHHFASVYFMHRQACDRKQMNIEERQRPVYRVGYAVQIEGMRWAAVKGELLAPLRLDAFAGQEYPVYVQSHALQRMKERLLPIDGYELDLGLCFENAEISNGPGGCLFVVLEHRGHKLGYLVTDFTGRELIVRSFLFITQTGTREGRALNERLRVEAYSKSYFGLDALMTYLATDICTDPFFRAVLTECGCEGLIGFKQALTELGLKDRQYSENLRRALALEDEEPQAEETVVIGATEAVEAG
jgi:hypothetical protein